MFRPNCRAIFRLIFEQVECTIDKASNLRDLILQELVNKILVCCIKKLKVKIDMWYCCKISIKNTQHRIPKTRMKDEIKYLYIKKTMKSAELPLAFDPSEYLE